MSSIVTAIWPSGTTSAVLPACWSPNRRCSTISPGAISEVATRDSIASSTRVRAPAGTLLTGNTVFSTMSFPTASPRVVPAGTVRVVT